MLFGRTQSYYVMEYLRLPYCLPLAALTGLSSKWLLASWLGIPRRKQLVWLKAHWPVIVTAMICIVLYFILAVMMTRRAS